MHKLKKIMSICFSLFMVVTAAVAGTLAFENLSAEEWAQWALENDQTIVVELLQQQRSYDENGALTGLELFEDYKVLVPLAGSAQYDGTNFDKYGLPMAEGYVDQIVRVTNTGTADAYVRVIVAVPAALDDANDAGHNALHWNLGNRFMENGSFTAENSVNGAFDKISWDYSQTAEVEGVMCNIYVFTYTEPLTARTTTEAAAFVGFYLDSSVDILDGYIMLDGVNTGFQNDSVKIHVEAQAVQSYGMGSSAEAAFATANMTENPWAEDTA